jgi:hypothetical protein
MSAAQPQSGELLETLKRTFGEWSRPLLQGRLLAACRRGAARVGTELWPLPLPRNIAAAAAATHFI